MSRLSKPSLARPPLLRMMRIHEQLQHRKPVNCTTIATLLEVSVKTAQRDIEFMRDQLAFPIEYQRAKHAYQYTREVTEFPLLRVTEGEVMALLVAQKALEQYRGTPFEQTLQRAFEKITSGLKDEISFDPSDILSGVSFRSFRTSKADVKTFEVMSQAIRLRFEVTLGYQKPGTTRREMRRVQPCHLANIQNLWYAICFDPSKQDFRKFALPRITSLQLETTRFERPAGFSPEQYLANAFGAFGGSGEVEVTIHFDAFAATYVRERSWHPSERFKVLPKGEVELSIRVPRLEEVESWVLSWGAHARVVAPPELAVAVRTAGAAIAEIYRDRKI